MARLVWAAWAGCVAALVISVPATAVAATHHAGAQPTATAAAQPTATAAASSVSTPSPFSQGVNPLGPVPTTTSATPTVINTSTSSAGSSSLTTGDAVLVAIGAAVLLSGIAFFIWRDARRRAPVRPGGEAALTQGRRAGSKPSPKPRKLSQAERRRRKRGRARR